MVRLLEISFSAISYVFSDYEGFRQHQDGGGRSPARGITRSPKYKDEQAVAPKSAQINFYFFYLKFLTQFGNYLDPVFKLWYSGCNLNDAFQGGIGKFFFNPCDINSETKYFVDSLDKVSLTDLVGVKGYNINTAQQSLKWKNEGGGGSLIKTAVLSMVGKTKEFFSKSLSSKLWDLLWKEFWVLAG